MKKTSTTRYMIVPIMFILFVALVWSCNNDDPTLQDLRNDKIAYLSDSLRISDSLKRVNAAGIVNYSILVINGSTSSIYGNQSSREAATQEALADAVVTISQYGKIMKDTTDASGMVVFAGIFRSAATVTIQKTNFTTVSYISAVHIKDSTVNGSINFVGNMIPLFETTGTHTATISGRVSIQTDLTNKVREVVPTGTTLLASIDARHATFADKFLTQNNLIGDATSGTLYVGEILQASYQSGTLGTTDASGNYTMTVPSAVDGLPIVFSYSQVAATQTLFEQAGILPGDRTATYRTLFGGAPLSYSSVPSGAGVTVSFSPYTTQATATAAVSSSTGSIDKINVTAGGAGYSGTPLVQINGGGTGATATATITNGVLTGITVNTPGTGYTAPTITLLQGTGASASVNSLEGTQTVLAVNVSNTGLGYTSAPTVTFAGGGGTTQATGTAVIANGRVTSVTVNTPGVGYTGTPTVTFTGGGAPTVSATATAVMSGFAVGDVSVTGGSGYTFAPAVTFGAPNLASGVRATGIAIVDPNSRTVTGIQVTNPGTGYTSTPSVTLAAFTTTATAEAFTTGGSVISVDINNNGAGYVGTPAVSFTGGNGTGAAGTAVMANGKVVGVTITNPGIGYTTSPTVTFVSGASANAFATVTNGVITGVTVSDGGHSFTEAPLVTFTSSTGGGATATATVLGGAITGVTVTTGGNGYQEGNTPNGTESFQGPAGPLPTKPGLKYVVDVYYGTGRRMDN